MQPSRRKFLTAAAGTGLALWWGEEARAEPRPIDPLQRPAHEKVRFACIGVGGKGNSDTADAARLGEVVAICDVDDNTLSQAARRYPNARRYADYRMMLAEMADQIDAVTVSTPDHHHASAAALAMNLGKHCFCQKPLTHSLYEARQLALLARKKRLATQMGNQGTADSGLRRNAARLRAGLLGTVKEVHIWTNRPIWPQGQARPQAETPPPHLAWDLWLGPAPVRPYGAGYHSFAWRGWWDFGTGALGDMGCHTINMPFMGLDLRDPLSVAAKTAGHNRDSFPAWSIITYQFGPNRWRPGLTLTWYDGAKKPDAALLDGRALEDSGALILGDKGKLYIPGDYAGDDGVQIGGVDIGEVQFPESPGHFEEFIRAIREGVPAMSNFPDYAGPLAETVLLGNLAVWLEGKTIEWDARNLRAKNAPEVAPWIRRAYRPGWSV